jgi:hypothetical protein
MGRDRGDRPDPFPAGEGLRTASDPGAVVLDIGAGTGALVVTTPARLCGREIEIHADGQPWRGDHTAVRERHAGAAVRYAGVFPGLRAGGYELRLRGVPHGVVLPIAVCEGAVVETWLDAPVD